MFDEELAQIPVQPPRTGLLPGMRITGAVPRTALILPLMMLVFFATIPLSILADNPDLKLQLGPSLDAQGTVREVSNAASCRSGSAHRIVYAFTSSSGMQQRGVDSVCEESPYYSVQVGDAIAIRYLTRDPAVNEVAGAHTDAPPLAFAFFPLFFPFFFLAIFAPLFLPRIREILRARRLYRTGVLAPGKVVFVKKRTLGPQWHGMQGNLAEVYVAYTQPGGQRAELIAGCCNDWLLNHLEPGAAVHVLHAPGGSARGAILEEFIR
jgi:hypothetical protein